MKKRIMIVFTMVSLFFVSSCGEDAEESGYKNVMYKFYKETFLLQNFDAAQELTVNIPKKKLQKESSKIDEKLREDFKNKFSIAYRKISNKDDSNHLKFQLFSPAFTQLVDVSLKISEGEWKVDKFTTKIFKDTNKMVDFLNSHEWKEKQLINKKE
ncbi:hypothetical protein [Sediminibacillus halophilus]|uniref:Uncharacterized protein n=1 Tax=Sediminibacillus halophilus TaxID=482461 RepID=A0A1G9MC34_9BACI|nr:hypothetical protein [Sediminibacillus halophilus]SDL71477.1 hypothetical protein SAMN05216244_0514 [Sediminibacillus halophilus]